MIFTIGYAGKAIEVFVEHLKRHGVQYLIDIRSVPYSSYYKEYDQTVLPKALAAHGITYVYMGAELGPRSKNPAHFKDSGQIDFKILSQSELFLKGIERLKKAENFNVCLMCAEKKPEVCHRALLVARYAQEHGLDSFAINYEGEAESFLELKERLRLELSLDIDFFISNEELQEQALDKMTEEFAYTNPNFKNNKLSVQSLLKNK